MGMNLVLAITSDADVCSFLTVGTTGTLSIVGVVSTETVAVQIPRVESPNETNDDHWTPLMQDGEAFKLTASDNARRLPVTLQIRLVKDAGASGNAYGVRWS